MKKEQKKRLVKIDLEPLYLINYSDDQNNLIYEFEVSGATANLYTVVFTPQAKNLNKMIKCNCVDATGVGKILRVKCKHACFIWVRILELPDEYLDFDLFSQSELEYLRKKIASLKRFQELNPCFRNLNQENKYRERLLIENKNFENTKLCGTDICPICILPLKMKQTSSCPDCKNLIHNDCVQTWLRLGKDTCVYCRSSSWKSFKLSLAPSLKPNPRYGSSRYSNLGKYTDFNSLGSESSTEEFDMI